MFTLDILFLVVKLYLFNSIQVNYYHLCCCNMQISSDMVYVVILDLIHDMLWTEIPFIFSIEEKILNLYRPVKTDLLWDTIILINGIGFVKAICIIYFFFPISGEKLHYPWFFKVTSTNQKYLLNTS